jgi:hypothetical protein
MLDPMGQGEPASQVRSVALVMTLQSERQQKMFTRIDESVSH